MTSSSTAASSRSSMSKRSATAHTNGWRSWPPTPRCLGRRWLVGVVGISRMCGCRSSHKRVARRCVRALEVRFSPTLHTVAWQLWCSVCVRFQSVQKQMGTHQLSDVGQTSSRITMKLSSGLLHPNADGARDSCRPIRIALIYIQSWRTSCFRFGQQVQRILGWENTQGECEHRGRAVKLCFEAIKAQGQALNDGVPVSRWSQLLPGGTLTPNTCMCCKLTFMLAVYSFVKSRNKFRRVWANISIATESELIFLLVNQNSYISENFR